METLKKWLPTLIAIGGLVTTALAPIVQNFWASHVTLAASIGSVLAIVANFAPQPHK